MNGGGARVRRAWRGRREDGARAATRRRGAGGVEPRAPTLSADPSRAARGRGLRPGVVKRPPTAAKKLVDRQTREAGARRDFVGLLRVLRLVLASRRRSRGVPTPPRRSTPFASHLSRRAPRRDVRAAPPPRGGCVGRLLGRLHGLRAGRARRGSAPLARAPARDPASRAARSPRRAPPRPRIVRSVRRRRGGAVPPLRPVPPALRGTRRTPAVQLRGRGTRRPPRVAPRWPARVRTRRERERFASRPRRRRPPSSPPCAAPPRPSLERTPRANARHPARKRRRTRRPRPPGVSRRGGRLLAPERRRRRTDRRRVGGAPVPPRTRRRPGPGAAARLREPPRAPLGSTPSSRAAATTPTRSPRKQRSSSFFASSTSARSGRRTGGRRRRRRRGGDRSGPAPRVRGGSATRRDVARGPRRASVPRRLPRRALGVRDAVRRPAARPPRRQLGPRVRRDGRLRGRERRERGGAGADLLLVFFFARERRRVARDGASRVVPRGFRSASPGRGARAGDALLRAGVRCGAGRGRDRAHGRGVGVEGEPVAVRRQPKGGARGDVDRARRKGTRRALRVGARGEGDREAQSGGGGEGAGRGREGLGGGGEAGRRGRDVREELALELTTRRASEYHHQRSSCTSRRLRRALHSVARLRALHFAPARSRSRCARAGFPGARRGATGSRSARPGRRARARGRIARRRGGRVASQTRSRSSPRSSSP